MMRLGISLQAGYLYILTALIILEGAGTIYALWAEDHAKTDAARNRLAIVNSRVYMGWWMIILVAASTLIGHTALVTIFALFSFLLLREFIALSPIKNSDHWVLIIAFYLALPIQYLFIEFRWMYLFTLFIPVYLFLLQPVVAALGQDTDNFLERVAKVQWGVMICVFCVSHAPAIATIPATRYNSSGELLFIFYCLVIFSSDLFSVLASSALGGRPLKMNPNKTVKGMGVGLFLGVVIGSALFWITPFRAWQATLFSILIVLTGAMGDIVISAIKRGLGIRSYEGETFIGRGIVPRFAPVLFSAPAFYHIATFFFTPLKF